MYTEENCEGGSKEGGICCEKLFVRKLRVVQVGLDIYRVDIQGGSSGFANILGASSWFGNIQGSSSGFRNLQGGSTSQVDF